MALPYRCGECGARFATEAEVVTHTAKIDQDGDQHDGTPWSIVDDAVAVVARRAFENDEHGQSLVPWSFFGRWRSGDSFDFTNEQSIGFIVLNCFRQGYVDVRVLAFDDAGALYQSTLALGTARDQAADSP